MKKIFVTILAILLLPINIFAGAKLNAPTRIVASKIDNTYKFEMDKIKAKDLKVEIDILNNDKWTSQSKKSIFKDIDASGVKSSVILTEDDLKNFKSDKNGYCFRIRYVDKNKNASPFTNMIHLGDAPLSRNSSAWALNDINKAKSLNVVSNSMFPNTKMNVTREELAEVSVKAYNNLNKRTSQGSVNHFTDTNNKYVNIAYDLGIMNGVGDGKFNPKGSVTREDYAVVASRIFGEKDGKSKKIKDVEAISAYAKKSVDSALNSGILTLDENAKFNPKKEMKREEILSSLVRNMQK